jgi:hypothetical protein
MPTSLSRSLFAQQLNYSLERSGNALRTGKRDPLSQSITNIYEINSCNSKIANLQNDSDSLNKSKSLLSSGVGSLKLLQEKLTNLKKIASQIASSSSDETKEQLIKNFSLGIKDYDSQAKSLGFNGTKAGAPKITTTGSNKFSAIDTFLFNPEYGPYSTRDDRSLSFVTKVPAGDNAKMKLEITIGDKTMTEEYSSTVIDNSNLGNTFNTSGDPLTRARNFIQSVLNSKRSEIKDMFNLEVINNPGNDDHCSVQFIPKSGLSNFNLSVNGRRAEPRIIGAINALEMRLINDNTKNKALVGFSDTNYANIGNIGGANNQAKSTTIILEDGLFDGNGGIAVGALGSRVADDTNANNVIYEILDRSSSQELQIILKDLNHLFHNSAAGLGEGFGGGVAPGDNTLPVVRAAIDAFAAAEHITDLTANFLKNNFFATAADGGQAIAIGNTTDKYCVGIGDDPNNGASIFGDVHDNNNGDALSLLTSINLLVTNAYYRKMILVNNNGIISEAAREELTNVHVAGSGLDASEASELYTVKTTYNGTNYIGITGGAGGNNLNGAGRSMFFFEADENGFPKAGAEIAFKLHFADHIGIHNVVGQDDDASILIEQLQNHFAIPRFTLGMTDTNSSAHISIKGMDLSTYSYVESATMETFDDNVILNIEINNAKFTCRKTIDELNMLSLGHTLEFTLDGSRDVIELTIKDLNNTSKSLFRDNNGAPINDDNLDEIATKFTEFFNGGALKVTTSSGLEIDLEQSDLTSTKIMDNTIISNITKDSANDVIAQLEVAGYKVLENLSSFVSIGEIVDSNISSTIQQMKNQETSLSSMEDTDIAEESTAFQLASRQRMTQERLFNIINTYTNNIENDILRNLQDTVRSMG